MEWRKDYDWRLYRNWLLAIMTVVVCFGSVLWIRTSLLHLIWIIPLCYVGAVFLQAHRLTHPRLRRRRHRPPADGAELAWEPVEFASQDGLRLSGWYAPGRNGAAVVLVHAFGMQGADMGLHAAVLAQQGYGVLVFDLRAHGHSEGQTCTLGWLETGDVLGAVQYARNQEEVDGSRIGVLGISLGAQAALRAAAQSDAIGAVVAEGPGPGGPSDLAGKRGRAWDWVGHGLRRVRYALLSFVNGVPSLPGLRATVPLIAPRPVLLISSGEEGEGAWMRMLYQAAADPKDLWLLPEARHGAGLLVYPQLYAQRVTAFFEAALRD
jgi:fermentation-respiration switch protein FrsA (DUF1100 family)